MLKAIAIGCLSILSLGLNSLAVTLNHPVGNDQLPGGEAGIIYVDDSATGANNGTGWPDAFTSLQDGLAVAVQGDEIRLAQGAYLPDRGAGLQSGARGLSFPLKEGVIIRGGYAGNGATNPGQCDASQYFSILSGDLAQNDATVAMTADLLTESTCGENSYHVVTGQGLSDQTALQGVWITGGNANGSGSNGWGGGISLKQSSPVIINCTISGNTGNEGTGITCDVQSSPRIENCLIAGNAALWIAGGLNCWWSSNPFVTQCIIQDNWTNGDGAGIYLGESSCPRLLNVTLTQNTAVGNGGGLYNAGGSPQLTGCQFTGNQAKWGGGLYNSTSSNPIVTDCLFKANKASSASGAGGGALNSNCQGIYSNCAFNQNSATWGGGMSNPQGGQTMVTDCLFDGNSATNSAGMENWQDARTVIRNCVFVYNIASNWAGGVSCGVDTTPLRCAPTIENCLFWGNRAENSNSGAIGIYVNGDPIIRNCTVYSNYSKYNSAINCNAQALPVISNCIIWGNSRNGTVDGTSQITGANLNGRINYCCVQGWTGTISGAGNMNLNPQFYSAAGGDFHLKSQNGRFSPATNTWMKDSVTSPCIDAGDPADRRWKNELWPHGGRINLGMWGGASQASLSSDVSVGDPADIDRDGQVNLYDFSCLANNWLQNNRLTPANLDHVSAVELADLLLFISHWTLP